MKRIRNIIRKLSGLLLAGSLVLLSAGPALTIQAATGQPGNSAGADASGNIAHQTVFGNTNYADVYDYDYYTAAYSDVTESAGTSDAAVLQHFVTVGMPEGRRGSAAFDVISYRNEYADLRKAYGNNLPAYYLHYIRRGKAENRHAYGCTTLKNPVTVCNGTDYSRVYNYSYYLRSYADVKAVFDGDDIGALQHFVTTGMQQKRRGSAMFDVDVYMSKYADLRKAYGSNYVSYYMHYIRYGYLENRSARDYSADPDGPVTVLDGVDYSRVYDYNYYISRYADVRNAYGNDDVKELRHFVNYGMKEQRQAKADFDVVAYRLQNPDLRIAFRLDYPAYYRHYMKYGYREPRQAVGTHTLEKPITKWNGVDYAAVYDFPWFIRNHPDLSRFANDDAGAIEYFVTYGMHEKRQACEDFNVVVYRSNYADLRNAYGTDYPAYYLHYIRYGRRENRNAATLKPDALVMDEYPYVDNYVTKIRGVELTSIYDYNYVINTYPEVYENCGTDPQKVLAYFANVGMRNGMDGMEVFDRAAYKAEYDPLRLRLNPVMALRDGEGITHHVSQNGKQRVLGIDVSHWQGKNIDWEKVRASGVEFVILKCGGRYLNSGENYVDEYFHAYIRGAKAAGLKVGIYFFSQAIDTAEAVEEAEYTVSLIRSYQIDLPVAFDPEFGSGNSGRLYKAKLTKAQNTAIAEAFLSTIENYGYQAMMYGSRSKLGNSYDMTKLEAGRPVWLANYTTNTIYSRRFTFWQFADNGRIDGINADVDCDIWYID